MSSILSAKIHKHKVVAPLSMDSVKVPREPFSTVLGMDMARSLNPCYLSRYPKTLMTYLSRNPFHVACTIAVIRKSIYRCETGLTVVVFYHEAFLFEGRSTTSKRPDKNVSILG